MNSFWLAADDVLLLVKQNGPGAGGALVQGENIGCHRRVSSHVPPRRRAGRFFPIINCPEQACKLSFHSHEQD